MKYKKIPENTFKQIQMNAGIVCTTFNPSTGVFSGLLGATTGGIQFTATPAFTDYGEDIDNCPKNTKELKVLDSWEAKMSGTFVTIDATTAKRLTAAADVDSNNSAHIIPRNDIEQTDFQDIWWVGDYSDVNTGNAAGFCAVHMKNALSTGGFQIKSTDKAKGNFAFEFTGHYSINAQDTVPFEIYVKSGTPTVEPSIVLDKHTINLVKDDTYTFAPTVVPSDATVTWSSGSDSVATVTSGGVVTAEGAGNTIITAAITSGGVTYSDTCTVIVTAASS